MDGRRSHCDRQWRLTLIWTEQLITGAAADDSISLVPYQAQCKVEQRGAAVEQDGEQRGGGGDEQTHVPAHHHPQRLQNLQNRDSLGNLQDKGGERA